MKRMHKKLLIILSLGFFSITSEAQNYPQGYFRSPLNIPMALVANFGEIRANHCHMGLDIRTQQRENLPVYAAADGGPIHFVRLPTRDLLILENPR